MKEKLNVTVYQCDHCSKKLFRKNAMVNHEVKCSKNPLNIRACFDCSLCKRVDIQFEPSIQVYTEADRLRNTTSFRCSSKKVFMYPPKLEYSENGVPEYALYNDDEITQEKMPLKCDLQKIEENIDFFNL